MAGISSKALNFGDPKNKEKTFQEQRFDDDLGLNWMQFKWRNHDPQIGRFIEIDPLSEDYVNNSTYAFSENKVTNHIELEGLEAVPTTGVRSPVTGRYLIQGDLNNDMVVDKSERDSWVGAVTAWINLGSKLTVGVLAPVAGWSLVLTDLTGIPHVSPGAPSSMGSTAVSETKAAVTATAKTETNLNVVAKESASALKASGQSPATVIAGQDLQGNSSVAKSGLNKTAEVAPQLKDAVKSLGGIGAKANNNTVGACAEFNLANPILKQNPNMKPWEIPMSNAIRPKTGNAVDPCPNCSFMFKPPSK